MRLRYRVRFEVGLRFGVGWFGVSIEGISVVWGTRVSGWTHGRSGGRAWVIDRSTM